MTQALFQPNFG